MSLCCPAWRTCMTRRHCSSGAWRGMELPLQAQLGAERSEVEGGAAGEALVLLMILEIAEEFVDGMTAGLGADGVAGGLAAEGRQRDVGPGGVVRRLRREDDLALLFGRERRVLGGRQFDIVGDAADPV